MSHIDPPPLKKRGDPEGARQQGLSLDSLPRANFFEEDHSTKPTQGSEGLLGGEFLTGARLLGWAGGLIFLLGVMYFLRFAIDWDWITPLGRILVAGIFGLGLAVAATLRFFRRIPLLGNILSGLGFAILYGCIFFAFRVYHLVGMATSFSGSILLTGGALFFALRWMAEGIALLALVGGFLSPMILSEGGGYIYSLFSYVAALDLAFLFPALKRSWRLVGPLSFFGTAFVATLWFQGGFDSSLLTPSLSFLAFFGLLFHAGTSIQLLRYGSGGRFELHGVYIALSFGVWVALGELSQGFPSLFAYFFLGISFVQMGTLVLLRKLKTLEPLALGLLLSHALSFLFLGIEGLLDQEHEVFSWGLRP